MNEWARRRRKQVISFSDLTIKLTPRLFFLSFSLIFDIFRNYFFVVLFFFYFILLLLLFVVVAIAFFYSDLILYSILLFGKLRIRIHRRIRNEIAKWQRRHVFARFALRATTSSITDRTKYFRAVTCSATRACLSSTLKSVPYVAAVSIWSCCPTCKRHSTSHSRRLCRP